MVLHTLGFLTSNLTGCGCTRPCTGNNGKSVPKFVLGRSLQSCCHSHCCRCVTSPIWLCYDTFTFRWATLYRLSFHITARQNKTPVFMFVYFLHLPDSAFECIFYVSQKMVLYVCHPWWITGGLMALSSIFVVSNSLLLKLHGSQTSRKGSD